MFALLLTVCIYGVACLPHVDIYPFPFAEVTENENLTLICRPFELLVQIAFSLQQNDENFYINQDDCRNTTGLAHTDPTPDMTFSCDLASSTFNMTLINVTRARDGQIWHCRVPVRGLAAGSKRSKDTTVVVKARTNTQTRKQTTALRRTMTPTITTTAIHIAPSLKATVSWMMTSFNNTSNPTSGRAGRQTTITQATTAISTPSSNMTGASVNTAPLDNPSTKTTRTDDSSIKRIMTISTPSSSTNLAWPPQSTARSPSFEPDPADYTLQMGFLVKVVLQFKEIYHNRSSPQFQSLATNFSVSLADTYKNINGFKSIDVLRFRPGSIIADYVVNFYPTVNIKSITSEIQTTVISSLKIVAGASVDINYTSEVMNERLAAVRDMDLCSLTSAELCPFGYSCKRSRWSPVLCVDRCDSTVCQNNGECYIDHHNSDVQCRCSIINGIAYSGSRCEIKKEVIPAEEKNLYLIISCSIAGGTLLIAIIALCVMKRRLAAQKKKLHKEHKIADDKHFTQYNGIHPANNEHTYNISNRNDQDGYMAMGYRDPNYSYPSTQYSPRVREASEYDYLDLQDRVEK